RKSHPRPNGEASLKGLGADLWAPGLLPGDVHRSRAFPGDVLHRCELDPPGLDDGPRAQRADEEAAGAREGNPGLSAHKAFSRDPRGRSMKRKPIERMEVSMEELKEILERTKGALSEEDYKKLLYAVETLGFLTSELEDKRTTIKRLRDLLFGPKTEKTANVL